MKTQKRTNNKDMSSMNAGEIAFLFALLTSLGQADAVCSELDLRWPRWPGLNDSLVPQQIFGRYIKQSNFFCEQRPMYEHEQHPWYILFGFNHTWTTFQYRWLVTDRRHCGSNKGIIHGSNGTLQEPSQYDTWWYKKADDVYGFLVGLELTCLDQVTTVLTTSSTPPTSVASTTITAVSTVTTATPNATISTVNSSTTKATTKKPGSEKDNSTRILTIMVGACTGGLVILVIIVVVIIVYLTKRRKKGRKRRDPEEYRDTKAMKQARRQRQNTYVTSPNETQPKQKHQTKTSKIEKNNDEKIYEEIIDDNGQYLTMPASKETYESLQSSAWSGHKSSLQPTAKDHDTRSQSSDSSHGSAFHRPQGYPNICFQPDIGNSHKNNRKYLDQPRAKNTELYDNSFDDPRYMAGHIPGKHVTKLPRNVDQVDTKPVPLRQISTGSDSSNNVYSPGMSESSSTYTDVSNSSQAVLLPVSSAEKHTNYFKTRSEDADGYITPVKYQSA